MGTKPEDVIIDTGDVDIEEILREILEPMFQKLQQDTQAYVESVVKSHVGGDEEGESEAGAKSVNPEVRALQNKLAQMERKAQEAEALERKRNIEAALAETVQAFGTDVPSLAQVALKDRAGELVESNGQYLTKDGKTISDLAKEFFDSPEGKRLLPADMRQGTGQPRGNAPRAKGNPELSTDEAIAATFGRL